MRAVVLVGWRPGCPHREGNWDIVRPWYEQMGLPVYTGDSDPELPFNLAAAVNRAARNAGDWDIAVIPDADTLIGPDELSKGIAAALQTGHLIQPFTRYWQLSQDGWTHAEPELFNAGGVIVIPRSVWDLVGGYDERFTKWGGHDSAMLMAAETLAGYWQLDGDVVHLWHPRDESWWSPVDDDDFTDAAVVQAEGAPPGFTDRARPFPKLGWRYDAALGDPDAMRALIAER